MCDHVARGDAPRAVVVDHAIANFERKYAYLVANVGLMDELFDAVFEERPDDDGTRPPFARCGLTGQYLQLVPRPNRLFNPFTKDVLSLPPGGALNASGGAACPACKSELLWYGLRDGRGDGAKATTYPLCGRCFDVLGRRDDDDGGGGGGGGVDVPGAGDAGDAEAATARRGRGALGALRALARTWGPCPGARTAVLECPMPDDHPALDAFRVLDDARVLFGGDARGAVLLETSPPTNRPPRLLSSRKPVFVAKFHASVASCKVVAGDDGRRRLRLAFVAGASPLDGGKAACTRLPTDGLVRSLLSTKRVDLAAPPPRGKGKGKGGRGRGGRGGRGKGRS